jgi:hypothetical protein
VDALEGLTVAHVKLNKRRFGDKAAWEGFTAIKEKTFYVDIMTSPERDAVYLRVLLAGFLSEQLFLGEDFYLASSSDETGVAYIVAHRVAQKTGRDANEIHSEAWAHVRTALKHNEQIVKAIARKLMYARVLRGKPLQGLLAKVEKPRADNVQDTLVVS